MNASGTSAIAINALLTTIWKKSWNFQVKRQTGKVMGTRRILNPKTYSGGKPMKSRKFLGPDLDHVRGAHFRTSSTADMNNSRDNNKSNQCNPNHTKSGPGRSSGYGGDKSKANLNNHANQMNPNHKSYQGSQSSSKQGSSGSNSSSWKK
ncbi:unnamed protein product [Allacma fusca]|uniref:Uncharacterized protein n=1 Tax=Allacma fusca TaxID=39272 RepID=A0A8J2KIA1_9HEXA|nr:unnamed protein product [Allacma fusca]